MPLVSIIITVYEVLPEYVSECLNSILNQTYQNIEVLVMNDCSPNTNYDFVSKLSPKIHLINNEQNLGQYETVNKAFTLVKGKYVVRLGADDLFDPKLIEKEVNYLENNPNVGGVCCELQRFGRRNKIIRRPKEWNLHNIVNNDLYGTGYDGGFMYRSSLLPNLKMDKSFIMAGDFDLQLQVLELMPIESIHEILYFYRSHETNLCKSIDKSVREDCMKRILEKHKN